MSDDRTGDLAKLREPFPSNQVNKLPKPYSKDSKKDDCRVCGTYHGLPAVHLDYVGHAALTDRFLDVDPLWSWEPLAVGPNGLPVFDQDGGLWIRLTLCGVTRLGYGDAQGKRGGNAVKEAIGDALRNAGMRFGAALDLWHKGELHNNEDASMEPRPAAEYKLPAPVKAPYDEAQARAAIKFAKGDKDVLRKAWTEAKASGATEDVLDLIATQAMEAVEGTVIAS